MGCGWYRGAYYPAEALIDRRSVEDLADELVREAEEGIAVDGLDVPVKPGIIGEIGTDKPWLSALEERVHRAVARASRRTGLAISTHAVMSDVGLAQLTVFEAEGADPSRVVIGHADSYPVLDHYLEIIRRGANIEFDFLGMTFTPQERHGEPRIIDLLLELLSRGHADRDPAEPGRLPQPAAPPLRGQRLHVSPGDVPAAPPRSGRLRCRDRAADSPQSAADPHHRVTARQASEARCHRTNGF